MNRREFIGAATAAVVGSVMPLPKAQAVPIGFKCTFSDIDYIEAEPEERLAMLVAEHKSSKSARHRTFIEGRMLELTMDMDDHPEWFDHGCLCAECRSYGE